MDKLVYLEEPVQKEYMIMTLFGSLAASYMYLITALKTMLMKELTAHLKHKMLKRKDKDPQGKVRQWCHVKAKRVIHL